MQKILVAVDFSQASERALSLGISIASKFDADLLITSVIERASGFARLRGAKPESAAYSPDDIRTKLKSLIPVGTLDSVNCDFLVREGIAADELSAIVDDHDVNLIVMGTHGRRPFASWLLGSVTDKLLREVSVPLLTVSCATIDDPHWTTTPKQILYATDFSYDSARGVEIAADFAEHFEAELTVMHVMRSWGGALSTWTEHDQSRLRENVRKQLEESVSESTRARLPVKLDLQEGVPYRAILDFAENKNMDLIVINLHGEQRVERTLLGSTAARVVRGAQKPVLSIPSVQF